MTDAITWDVFGSRDLNPPPMCSGTPHWEDQLENRPSWASPLFMLSSEDGFSKAIFCPHTNRIHFQSLGANGVYFNGHDLFLLAREDASRVITHFDGYCQGANTRPLYHAWCRGLVADRLLAGVLRFYWNMYDESQHAAMWFKRLTPVPVEHPAQPAA